MKVTFSMRADRQVDAHLGPEWPLFNEALADSISSLPPRGASGLGPSTYWIDHAERGARRAVDGGDDAGFIGGNITWLCVRSGFVVAHYDFDEENDDPGEALPVEDFLSLLAAWREKVLASAAGSTEPLPETYRRNPYARPVDRQPAVKRVD